MSETKEKKTVLKKGNSVSVQTKKGGKYSYKYTDLAQIHEYLEAEGLSYEATIKRVDGEDYMFITKIDKDGNKSEPMQEAKIPKVELSDRSNAAQEYGSALTYARRYSLLMAYGLATEDDDANSLNRPKTTNKPKEGELSTGDYKRLDFDKIRAKLKDMNDIDSVNEYAKKVAVEFPKMTKNQRDTIASIFKKKREEFEDDRREDGTSQS